MGLLDQVAGQVLGGLGEGSGGASPWGPLLQALLQREGGLSGLVARLQGGGLAEQVSSWIGQGANLPVSPEQLQAVLGTELLASLGASLGVDADQAGAGLASGLPALIDRLSPAGALVADEQGLRHGLEALGGLFDRG